MFSPDGTHVYVVEELSSELTVFDWNSEQGVLTELQTISTLPPNCHSENLAADVHILSPGKFLYCSNRGDNSIACFRIDSTLGYLDLVSHTPFGGSWPRNFAIDPKESSLFVANSKSNSIARFKIDPVSGILFFFGNPLYIVEPMCIKFAFISHKPCPRFYYMLFVFLHLLLQLLSFLPISLTSMSLVYYVFHNNF